MLEFFGKGSAFSEDINSSAYIYDEPSSSLFIIDVGENTFQTIKDFIEKNNVKNVNVIITHMHADHVGGLSTLIYYMHFIRKSNLKIKAGKEVAIKIRDLLKLMMHSYNEYELLPMTPTLRSRFVDTYDLLEIVPFETEHVKEHICYGYLISNLKTGKNCYYSGDSVILPKHIKDGILNKEPNDELTGIRDRALKSIDFFYQDLTHLHYDGNVHMSIEKFKEEYPVEAWSKVIPYHCDMDAIRNKCIELDVDINIDNTIELKMNKDIIGISGKDYGIEMYETQIKPFLNDFKVNTIMFPKHVRNISMSFIQGCFGEIRNKMTIKDFKNKIKIIFLNKEKNDKLTSKLEGELF